MAPEQHQGRTQDERVDIWAFGVLLYHVLTGRLPFLDAVHSLTEPPPPLDASRPDLSATWSRLIMDCLARDPGARPSSFAEVRARIARSHATLTTLTPELESGPHTNLSPTANTFIGRVVELNTLDELYEDADARLVTLTGPPGVGKTRLAREFAWESAQRYGHRAFVCDLADTRSATGALVAVADALGLPGARHSTDTLFRAMQAGGDTLLVLDNVEHLVDDLADLAQHWSAPGSLVRLLLTSRQPLFVGAERVVEVAPLSLAWDAVELFRARMNELDGMASPSSRDQDDAQIALLVAELDGLPLAIELAAARTQTLSPANLLARMDQRFKLLRSKRRDVHERHATLASALEWSWELMDPWERDALAQLSIFEGGFSLDAAEDVIALDPDAPPVIDVLERLIDRCMLRVQNASRRFELLRSIQLFARGKLDDDATLETLRARHMAFYSSMLPRERVLRSPQNSAKDVRRDRDNLGAALEHAIDVGAGQRTDIALILAAIAEGQGPLEQGVEALDLVLADARELPGADIAALRERRAMLKRLRGEFDDAKRDYESAEAHADDDLTRASLQGWSAVIDSMLGDYEHSMPRLEAALASAEESGDDYLISVWCMQLGHVGREQGTYERASSHYARSLEHARACQDTYLECSALGSAGIVYHFDARLTEAQDHYTRAIKLARAMGNVRLTGIWLGHLAHVTLLRGEYERAERQYERALTLIGRLGERNFEGLWTGNLAIVQLMLGKLDEAAAGFELALAIDAELGQTRYRDIWMGHRAQVAWARGDVDEARRGILQTISRARERGAPSSEGMWTMRLGRLEAEVGHDDVALALFEDAEALLETDDELFEQAELWAARGLVLARRGEHEGALADLERVGDAIARIGLTPRSIPGEPATKLARLLGVDPHDLFVREPFPEPS